jgi:hypothetical protein
MKALTDASFFRAFDGLVSAGNPGLKRASWSHAGASWRRERHSFSGVDHSFAVEVFTVAAANRGRWTLLVVREHWWLSGANDAVKSLQWARPTSGAAAEILAWLRERAGEEFMSSRR